MQTHGYRNVTVCCIKATTAQGHHSTETRCDRVSSKKGIAQIRRTDVLVTGGDAWGGWPLARHSGRRIERFTSSGTPAAIACMVTAKAVILSNEDHVSVEARIASGKSC